MRVWLYVHCGAICGPVCADLYVCVRVCGQVLEAWEEECQRKNNLVFACVMNAHLTLVLWDGICVMRMGRGETSKVMIERERRMVADVVCLCIFVWTLREYVCMCVCVCI